MILFAPVGRQNCRQRANVYLQQIGQMPFWTNVRSSSGEVTMGSLKYPSKVLIHWQLQVANCSERQACPASFGGRLRKYSAAWQSAAEGRSRYLRPSPQGNPA